MPSLAIHVQRRDRTMSETSYISRVALVAGRVLIEGHVLVMAQMRHDEGPPRCCGVFIVRKRHEPPVPIPIDQR